MTYRERDQQKRKEFKQEIETIKQKNIQEGLPEESTIVYIDESGIDHNEIKSRSWSPIGKPTPSEQYGYKYKRTTLIAGTRRSKDGKGMEILAPFRFEGMTNTDIFNTWIEECLCPELKVGDVVVLDNASFHKSQKTKDLIEKRGVKLLYLPPYSPDLNPIENYWALLKLYVRKRNTAFDVFYTVLDEFLTKDNWCYLN